MAGQHCPGLVVVGRGLLGKGRGPRGASPESTDGGGTGRGLHPEPRPLEEDDIFLAGFFLVEWCGEQGHGWEGCPPGLEGEVLVGDISRDRGWGWEAGVWKREGVVGVRSCQALWVPGGGGGVQAGSPGGGVELRRTGLSERRLREAFSSLPMNLLRSSGCFRSNEAGSGRKVPAGVLGLAPGTGVLCGPGPGPHPPSRPHFPQRPFPGIDPTQTLGPKFSDKIQGRHPCPTTEGPGVIRPLDERPCDPAAQWSWDTGPAPQECPRDSRPGPSLPGPTGCRVLWCKG